MQGRCPGYRVNATVLLPEALASVARGRSLAGYSCGGSRGFTPRSDSIPFGNLARTAIILNRPARSTLAVSLFIPVWQVKQSGMAQVRAFYQAARAAGGTDNGPPGIRDIYHPNYYGAFVIGPDGHNIEAVCHAPARSEALS